MGQIFYIIKIAVITFAVVLLMQIKIDETTTVENHVESFIRTSVLTSPIREIAQGGFLLVRNTYHGAIENLNALFTKNFQAENSPGKRKFMELKRSLGFEKEIEKKKESASQVKEDAEEYTEVY